MDVFPPEKIDELKDFLGEKFSTGEFYSAVHAAKLEFFQKAGTISEDDIEFETRMNVFMDWYLIDRDLPGIDLPPVKYYLRENLNDLEEQDLKVIRSFTETLHSIFEIKKIKNNEMVLLDLFPKKKYTVMITKLTPALTKGEIFEGRVIPFEDKHILSSGICLHPVEMKKYIIKEIKKIRHMGRSHHRELIMKLADMKLKHSRYQHIDPKFIYSDEPAF
jgi:hypothetical protein